MVSSANSVRDDELTRFLDVSRLVVARASVLESGSLALLATPPDGKYPFRDTRTLAVGIVALTELGDYQSARAMCNALLAWQASSGAWPERPSAEANEAPSPAAEDVTALALWALLTYVRASGDDELTARLRAPTEEAVRYVRARTLNPYLHLIETSLALHGPALDAGYDLWTNCAHAAAFALCHRVYGGERHRRLALLLRRAIGLLLTAEGRFLRRLDPRGYPDPRPDVALLAPYYFKLWAPTERMVMNSVDLVERSLWNVEFGGYIRYLPFSAEERRSLLGPSPCFTAWMAQYHYDMGNRDRAEAIARWLFDQAVGGQLADVLVPGSVATRYLPEQRNGLEAVAEATGDQDAARERLRQELDALDAAPRERQATPTGVPLVWAHLETLRALYKGGYFDYWQLGSAPTRLGGGQPK
jgi:GH15 family glucan-1,4-alpha-glucosidase